MSKKGAQVRHRVIVRDSIFGITKPAIRRAARVGGCKALSSLVYEEIRGVLRTKLTELLKDADSISFYMRTKTITLDQVVAALKAKNVKFVASVEGLTRLSNAKLISHGGKVEGAATRKAKHGAAALREIKRAQKMSDKLILPVVPFRRLVREISQDLSERRFSNDAKIAIQLYAEDYLVNLFDKSAVLANGAGRKTVNHRDVTLAYTLSEK